MIGAALGLAGCAWAADLWLSRPFAEWTDKDAQKIINASPWARQISVMPSGARVPSYSGDRRGSTLEDNPAIMRAPTNAENAEVTAKPRENQAGDDSRQIASGPVKLVIQWRSALPVRQALARAKFGVEAATSAEAKQFIETEPSDYVIAVIGIPRAFLSGDGESLKKTLMERATLSAGGKARIHPSEIQFRAGPSIDVFFAFPRTSPFTAEDKRVEFVVKLDPLAIKEDFRLRDMMFQGKLEL